MSFFLLLQSVAFLKWATKDEEDAPDPKAGVTLAWVLTLGIMLFSFFNSNTFHIMVAPKLHGSSDLSPLIFGLLFFPFWEPAKLAEILLYSSVPIGIIAAYKFLLAASIARSAQAAPSALTRSPLAIVIAGLFTLLQLAGSVASIIGLLR